MHDYIFCQTCFKLHKLGEISENLLAHDIAQKHLFVHWNDEKVKESHELSMHYSENWSLKKKKQKKEFEWRDSVLYIAMYCRWRLLQSSCCAVAAVSQLQLSQQPAPKLWIWNELRMLPVETKKCPTWFSRYIFDITPGNLHEFSIKMFFFHLNETVLMKQLLQLIIFMISGPVIWL